MTFASSSAHAKKHARVRDVAAASSFATPGVYWNSPQPARWAVPASDAKYEFQVYVREITDYVDSTFPSARDEANDLPPTLATVTKTMGKEAVRSSSCPLSCNQNRISLLHTLAKPYALHPSLTSLTPPLRCLLRSRTATRLPFGLRAAWP